MHRTGARSFSYLRTINGIEHPSYRDACVALNLVQYDRTLIDTLKSAFEYQMPLQLRSLFCCILLNCEPSNPLELWNIARQHMIDDFLHSGHSDEESEQLCLHELEKNFKRHQKSCLAFGLPPKDRQHIHQALKDDSRLSKSENKSLGERQFEALNPEQRKIFDKVIKSIESSERSPKIFLH